MSSWCRRTRETSAEHAHAFYCGPRDSKMQNARAVCHRRQPIGVISSARGPGKPNADRNIEDPGVDLRLLLCSVIFHFLRYVPPARHSGSASSACHGRWVPCPEFQVSWSTRSGGAVDRGNLSFDTCISVSTRCGQASEIESKSTFRSRNTEHGVTALHVAVRRSRCKMAISPKKSPANSVPKSRSVPSGFWHETRPRHGRVSRANTPLLPAR